MQQRVLRQISIKKGIYNPLNRNKLLRRVKHYGFGLTALGLWLMASDCFSAQLDGILKDPYPMNWLVDQSTNLTPSLWDIAIQLPVAEQVIPGGASFNGQEPLLLTHVETGEQVPISFQIEGMEYRLSQQGEVVSDPIGSAETQVMGQVIRVIGDVQQVGKQGVRYHSAITPFTHYRPVFDLGGLNWNDRFKDKPSGRYHAKTSLKMRYDYVRNGVRIANHLIVPLMVSVEYHGNKVTSVQVLGTDVIEPVFSGEGENEQISGKTQYQINVKGTIPNGVWVGLKQRGAADEFHLKPPANGKGSIPYSVLCFACEGQQLLIDNGSPRIGWWTNRVKLPSQHPDSASTLLEVSYQNIAVSDLSLNTPYQGAFTLLFEAVM